MLDQIEETPLRPDITGGPRPGAILPGSDWPSLGGSAAHEGFSPDPGPVVGKEFWRFPVGYDFRAGAVLRGNVVYVPSPGTETILYAFDRDTGAIHSILEKPAYAHALGYKAGGEIQFYGEHLASFCGLDGKGNAGTLYLADLKKNTVVKIDLAKPSEQRWTGPETEPEPRRAFVADNGESVAVKSLKADRMWWKFPAGPLACEPTQTADMVFSGNDEGVLRALRMDGPLRIAWQFSIPAAWRARVTVTNGVVYAGANNGSVYAVDAATGKLLWQAPVSKPNPRAYQHFSPAMVTDQHVVVGAADGFLYCLNAKDGSLRWKADAGDWVRARPFINGSTVVAANLSGEVLAFRNREDRAELLWKTKVSEHELFGDLTGDDRGVLVTSSHLWLTAVALADGAVQWRQRLLPNGGKESNFVLADAPPQIPQSPPTVATGVAYVGGADRFIQAVNMRTGKRVWRFEANGLIAAAPSVGDGKVLVGEYLGGKAFTAVNAETGLPVWSQPIGGVWASPQYEDGRIYVGTTEGWMYALRARDGETLWRWKTGDGIYTAPALDEQRVYFGSWDGRYYALNKRTGELVWAWSHPGYPYNIGGRPDSPAAVLYKGKLIVPALGGRYVALDSETGKTLWNWFPPPRSASVT